MQPMESGIVPFILPTDGSCGADNTLTATNKHRDYFFHLEQRFGLAGQKKKNWGELIKELECVR